MFIFQHLMETIFNFQIYEIRMASNKIEQRLTKSFKHLQDSNYLGAVGRINELDAKIKKANRFTIDPIRTEYHMFTEELYEMKPEIYKILRAGINGLAASIAMKKSSLKIIID